MNEEKPQRLDYASVPRLRRRWPIPANQASAGAVALLLTLFTALIDVVFLMTLFSGAWWDAAGWMCAAIAILLLTLLFALLAMSEEDRHGKEADAVLVGQPDSEDHAAQQPVAGKLLPGGRLGLGNFALIVREDVVDAAAMQVERQSERYLDREISSRVLK